MGRSRGPGRGHRQAFIEPNSMLLFGTKSNLIGQVGFRRQDKTAEAAEISSISIRQPAVSFVSQTGISSASCVARKD